MRRAIVFFMMVMCGVAAAKKVDNPLALDSIGPYRLGSSYDDLKKRPGYTEDPERTKPAEGIVAGKIIDKEIAGTPTVQRLIFKNGKLIRVSIIFFPPEKWNEEAVKAWCAAQWGDPGPREQVGDTALYVWDSPGTAAMIMSADKGMYMVSLARK
jgi:hypothetical protein